MSTKVRQRGGIKISAHTSRSIKYYENKGYIVGKVESWVPNPRHPGGGFRRDLFNFADLLCFNRLEVLLVQSCGSDFAAHLKKVYASEIAHEWLCCGNRIEVIGWRKLKNRLKSGGFGKGYHYEPRVEIIREVQ